MTVGGIEAGGFDSAKSFRIYWLGQYVNLRPLGYEAKVGLCVGWEIGRFRVCGLAWVGEKLVTVLVTVAAVSKKANYYVS